MAFQVASKQITKVLRYQKGHTLGKRVTSENAHCCRQNNRFQPSFSLSSSWEATKLGTHCTTELTRLFQKNSPP